jgi:cupin fold WbuC family metalloprotein
MINQVYGQNSVLLASVITAEADQLRADAAGPEEILQASRLRLPQNKTISPHRHLPVERTTQGTQEAWVVISGVIQAQVFDVDSTLVQDITLGAGDCMVLYKGGHTFTVTSEDAVLYEIKNGPYYGPAADQEKI